MSGMAEYTIRTSFGIQEMGANGLIIRWMVVEDTRKVGRGLKDIKADVYCVRQGTFRYFQFANTNDSPLVFKALYTSRYTRLFQLDGICGLHLLFMDSLDHWLTYSGQWSSCFKTKWSTSWLPPNSLEVTIKHRRYPATCGTHRSYTSLVGVITKRARNKEWKTPTAYAQDIFVLD